MRDAPIITHGTIIARRDERTFRVELKNGKIILGHVAKKLADQAAEMREQDTVTLEMTPFDFEKGRIAAFTHPDTTA